MERAAAQQREKINVDKEDEDVNKVWQGYAWESNKIRSWEQIEEDPLTGRLKSYEKAEQIARKKRRDDGLSGIRRGVIRFCVIVIDMSEPLRMNDYKPSRAELIIDSVTTFISEFLDQNPISQICIVITRESDAAKLCSFTNNIKVCTEALKNALRLGPKGTASLQNAISVGKKLLSAVPPYGMKEILVCYGSLSTCDPGDIHSTIDSLVDEKIRCVAVGMAAELYVLKTLTKKTSGNYIIAVDESHFRDALSTHVIPPPATTRQVSASLIRMGYPVLKRIPQSKPYCNTPIPGRIGYNCPRCSAWLSEMPCECVLCGMTLVSSPHLARSYHHLFPVPKYVPLDSVNVTDIDLKSRIPENGNILQNRLDNLKHKVFIRCTGCVSLLKKDEALRVICPSCLCPFCIECDAFVHESLHHCPGCGLTKHQSIDTPTQ